MLTCLNYGRGSFCAFSILPSEGTWSRAAGAAKAAWSWYSGWISLQQQEAGSPACCCLLPTQWSMTQQKASLCMLKEEVGGSPDRRRY